MKSVKSYKIELTNTKCGGLFHLCLCLDILPIFYLAIVGVLFLVRMHDMERQSTDNQWVSVLPPPQYKHVTTL